MGVCVGPCRVVLVCLGLLIYVVPSGTAWDADLELLDLVEEIPQTFYQFLSLEQVRASCSLLNANCLHGNRTAAASGMVMLTAACHAHTAGLS